MDYTEFMRVIEKPYWCNGSPLKWEVPGVGISHFARNAKPGMFNLSWLMLQRTTPPLTAKAYQNTPLTWVIMLSGGTMVEGRSLEHHASMLQLSGFKSLMHRFIAKHHPHPLDYPGSVPWKTLYELSTAVERKT